MDLPVSRRQRARDVEQRVLNCDPERGVRPDPEAPRDTPAGVGAVLDQGDTTDSMSHIRCLDADGSDGWDVICTYFGSTMGERMKAGYRIGPNSEISGGGSVPEDMPLGTSPY